MDFDYSALATVADELLIEFGRAVTIRRQTAGAYDPATGSATVTTADESGHGAIFDFGLHQAGTQFAAGSMILSGDKQLLLSPTGVTEPKPGHLAIVGADTWNIVSVKTTAPAGTAVLYECQLRK